MTNDDHHYIEHWAGSLFTTFAVGVLLAALIKTATDYTGSCGWVLTAPCSMTEYIEDRIVLYAVMTSFWFIGPPILFVLSVAAYIFHRMRKPGIWIYWVAVAALPLIIAVFVQMPF